jgi:hypothetical protein
MMVRQRSRRRSAHSTSAKARCRAARSRKHSLSLSQANNCAACRMVVLCEDAGLRTSFITNEEALAGQRRAEDLPTDVKTIPTAALSVRCQALRSLSLA